MYFRGATAPIAAPLGFRVDVTLVEFFSRISEFPNAWLEFEEDSLVISIRPSSQEQSNMIDSSHSNNYLAFGNTLILRAKYEDIIDCVQDGNAASVRTFTNIEFRLVANDQSEANMITHVMLMKKNERGSGNMMQSYYHSPQKNQYSSFGSPHAASMSTLAFFSSSALQQQTTPEAHHHNNYQQQQDMNKANSPTFRYFYTGALIEPSMSTSVANTLRTRSMCHLPGWEAAINNNTIPKSQQMSQHQSAAMLPSAYLSGINNQQQTNLNPPQPAAAPPQEVQSPIKQTQPSTPAGKREETTHQEEVVDSPKKPKSVPWYKKPLVPGGQNPNNSAGEGQSSNNPPKAPPKVPSFKKQPASAEQGPGTESNNKVPPRVPSMKNKAPTQQPQTSTNSTAAASPPKKIPSVRIPPTTHADPNHNDAPPQKATAPPKVPGKNATTSSNQQASSNIPTAGQNTSTAPHTPQDKKPNNENPDASSQPQVCKHCGNSNSKGTLQEHEARCPFRKMKCQTCGAAVMAKDASKHKAECKGGKKEEKPADGNNAKEESTSAAGKKSDGKAEAGHPPKIPPKVPHGATAGNKPPGASGKPKVPVAVPPPGRFPKQ